MHHERGNLLLEHLHAIAGDDAADVGHERGAEDLVDESMIALVARRRHVLHREAVVNI